MNALFLYGFSLALVFGPVAAVLVQTGASLPTREGVKSACAVAIADVLLLLTFLGAGELLGLAETDYGHLINVLAILASCYLLKVGVALAMQSLIEQVDTYQLSWKNLFIVTITNPGTSITTASVVLATKHLANSFTLLSGVLFYFAGSLLGQHLYLLFGHLVRLGKRRMERRVQHAVLALGGAYIVVTSIINILGNAEAILKR